MSQKETISTKKQVLQLLEEHKGLFLSGSQMAADLSVSRAAIWKVIKQLREEGYAIKAVTNKGYTLPQESDRLSPAGIACFLKHKALKDHILTYPEVESTNLTLKALALKHAPHGTTVIAETQTQGRGRMGRSFFSPAHSGIYMSILLRLDSMKGATESAMLMTTAASVAVARAIASVTGKEVTIKWVNDLFLQNKKVCGILTEGMMDLESGTIESMVLGIGINFDTPLSDFVQEDLPAAGSLFSDRSCAHPEQNRKEHSPVPSKNKLIASVLDHVLDICPELPDTSFLAEYKARSFILGKPITVISATGAAAAKALDIAENGGLLVEFPDGSRRTLTSGEVSIKL